MRNKFYNDFKYSEIHLGLSYMRSELAHLDNDDTLIKLFELAWLSFVNGDFSYDGATFVKERNSETVFEVASFIHDFRNSLGYVSKEIDKEFVSIMIVLNYDINLILERYFFMAAFTWLNVLRHKYWLKDLRNSKPIHYYELPEVFINP